jgi:Common central domain of tyrosinase
MSELDIPPWQQPETVPATTEWLDEGPFVAGAGTVPVTESPFGAELGVAAETTGVAGEGEVPGCGQVPAGPRPLLLRSTGTANSRNPSVGYAQTLLNVFLASLRGGSPSCNDTRATTQQYIQSLHGLLVSLKQDPLVVDCMFGQATEVATKMFQACRGLVRDGKIGDRTWPELEKLGSGQPAPPVPVPPVPTPPVTTGIRVREDVWRLSAADPWHPTLLWYARGVRSLQARNGSNAARPVFADPRSWRHLAETHGTFIPEPQRPPGAKWDSCEHGSWHFLPWHRVYVHHFERIMRDEIVALGGPSGWALPFWNYSDNTRPEARRIPPAFRATNLPGGTPNPLRVEARAPGINTGSPIVKEAVDTTEAFDQTMFTPPFGPGFGGRSAPVQSHNGTAPGLLERIPHAAVHSEVGGADGWMSQFETAAQDPIFWLHHANIDRLWEAWLRARPTNRNPGNAAWLNPSRPFTFGSGSTITTLTAAQVVDPRQPPLSYRYSDMPVTPTPEAFAERPDEVPEFIGEDETRPPELVGASAGPVPLGAQATTARVDVSTPTGPVARETERGTPPANARVYLRLENITATRVHTSGVEVYVNVPAGGRPKDFPDRRAGLAPMFGVIEASRRTSTHSGSGLDLTFDITRIVRALAAAGAWDPTQLQVTFVPLPDATGRVGQGDVQVGRVSVFYA